MKVLVIALGSRGDLNPMLQVADKLKRRGHDVVLCGSENYRELVERFNIRFVPHLNEEIIIDYNNNSHRWHFTRALSTLSRLAIVPSLKKIYRVIEQEMTDDLMIVSSPLAFAAKIAEEKLGLKLVHLLFAPMNLRSVYETSWVGGVPMGPFMPKFYKKFIWWMIDRFFLDPPLINELNRFRKEMGLAPVSRIFHRWWFSASHTALLFSEHFAPQQKDWPATAKVYDFLCFDGADEISSEADFFLAKGSKPVVFTFGTPVVSLKQDFEISLEVLRRLNLRGIFLAKNPADFPKKLPGTLLSSPFLPLGKILPQCAAIVHHGGIGTIAQALRAGIPQLIRPMFFDQPDNAYRIHKKKLGSYILPQQYFPNGLCKKLTNILHDEQIKANSQAFSRKLDPESALERLVHKIEQIGNS